MNFDLIRTSSQMVSERQKKESAPPVVMPENGTEKTMYFLAEVCYIFLIFPFISFFSFELEKIANFFYFILL